MCFQAAGRLPSELTIYQSEWTMAVKLICSERHVVPIYFPVDDNKSIEPERFRIAIRFFRLWHVVFQVLHHDISDSFVTYGQCLYLFIPEPPHGNHWNPTSPKDFLVSTRVPLHFSDWLWHPEFRRKVGGVAEAGQRRRFAGCEGHRSRHSR